MTKTNSKELYKDRLLKNLVHHHQLTNGLNYIYLWKDTIGIKYFNFHTQSQMNHSYNSARLQYRASEKLIAMTDCIYGKSKIIINVNTANMQIQ